MRINPDLINSLNENYIELAGTWLWADKDIYSFDYLEVLSQPVSLNVVTMDFLRFKDNEVTLTIRSGITSATPLVYLATIQTLPDTVSQSLVGFSVGCSDPFLKDIVDNGNGTINISACNVYLLDNPDGRGFVNNYSLSPVTLTIPNNIESYVCTKYNSGSPIIYLETDKTKINESDISCLYILWRQDNIVHSIGRDSKGLNLSNKIAKSILNTKPYSKSIDGGLVISESSTPTNRTVLVTSAVVYSGIVPVNVLSFNSSTDKLTLAYHSSGVWNYSSSATVYNNTQYDDGTNLQTIPNNKYAVRYFYRSIGDIKETFYVLCNTYHNNIEDAKLDGPRSDIPILLRDHCVLIGRIIVKYNESSGYVENINDQNFIPTQVSNHNDLANIQGGSVGSYYHVSATTFEYLSGVSADIQEQINSKVDFSVISAGLMEPTGFPRIDNTTISFNNSTRSFNISGIESWNIYYRGTKYTKISESITIPNLSGVHFIYFTSAGTLTTSQIPWDILTTIQISIVYWDGTKAIYFADERHGCIMDGMTHKYNHLANWTKYINGFNPTYTIGNDSSAYFGVSNGMIADEDIFLSISQGSSGNYFTQQINFPGYFPVYYRSGVDGNGTWKKDVSTIYPYKGTSGGYVNYNSLTGGIWGQTQLTVGNYGAFFIYATNNMWEPVICVQSQRNDATLLDSQTYNTPSTLRFDDLPFQEAKLLYRIIVRTNASYTGNPFKIRIEEVTDYRSDTAIINAAAGGTGTGTVTSVALTAPLDFVVTGSPITLAGTLGLTYSNQTPNTFLAGPISGSASTPSFRNLTSSDIPDVSNRYLPLSGGTLTGQLKGTTISASGNISATNFVGNLTGYKNIDNTNEITIANGYSSTGVVWFNYRGATSAITEYRLGSGKSDGSYASIRANSYIVSGGSSNQFLKGDGSLDSTSYTSQSTVSAISGNLQTQIIINNNSLSGYLPLSGGSLTGDLKVSAPFTYNFGDSFNKFYNSYFYNIDTTNISAYNSYVSQQIIASNIKPDSSFIVDIGTTTNRFKDLYIKNITSNALTTTDTSVTNKFKTIFGTTDTSASTTPHIHFEPRSLAINTSGDMYFDGLRLQLNDKNNIQNTIAYTTDLSAYQSISGLSNQLSGYYRTSGGPIFGSVSASGNITCNQFNGNLNGYKNVDNSNECTISNGFASGNILYINYRGATSAINEYRFCKGQSAATYSDLRANAFIKNGGTNTQFLKADGTVDSNTYALNSSLGNYLPLSGGTLTGNLIVKEAFVGTSAVSDTAYFGHKLKIGNYPAITQTFQGITTIDSDVDAYYNGLNLNVKGVPQLLLDGTSITANFNLYSPAFIKSGGASDQFLMADGSVSYADSLSNKFLPLSGGTLSRNLKISAVSEGWSEGIRIMSPSNSWGGVRLSRNSSTSNTEGNWAIGYANNNSDNLEIDVYTTSTQLKHTIFYKNGDVYHVGNLSANSFVKLGGTSSQFLKADGTVDSNTYALNSSLGNYLPLSGGTLSGNLVVKEAFIGTSGASDTAYFGHKLKIGNYPAITQNFQGITTIDSDVDAYYNGLSLNIKGDPQLLLNGTSIDAYSSITAPAFLKNGGSSDQFLMADGSVSYADSLKTKFLPLSGGYMTGQIQTSSSISFKDSSNTEQILISGGVISFGSDIPKLNLSKITDGSYERLDLSTNNHPTTRASLNASGYIRCQKGLGLNGNDTYLTSVPELTGSRSSGTALTNLIEILKNYGLIIDNTTA